MVKHIDICTSKRSDYLIVVRGKMSALRSVIVIMMFCTTSALFALPAIETHVSPGPNCPNGGYSVIQDRNDDGKYDWVSSRNCDGTEFSKPYGRLVVVGNQNTDNSIIGTSVIESGIFDGSNFVVNTYDANNSLIRRWSHITTSGVSDDTLVFYTPQYSVIKLSKTPPPLDGETNSISTSKIYRAVESSKISPSEIWTDTIICRNTPLSVIKLSKTPPPLDGETNSISTSKIYRAVESSKISPSEIWTDTIICRNTPLSVIKLSKTPPPLDGETNSISTSKIYRAVESSKISPSEIWTDTVICRNAPLSVIKLSKTPPPLDGETNSISTSKIYRAVESSAKYSNGNITYEQFKNIVDNLYGNSPSRVESTDILPSQLTVVPNPSATIIHVNFKPTNCTTVLYQLLDISGKELDRIVMNSVHDKSQTVQFNIQNLAHGTYFISTQSCGTLNTTPFIKQ